MIHTGTRIACLLALLATLGTTSVANAQIYINEIHFDPPGEEDGRAEYIELRGDPNTSLANHYLLFLENETSATANPGEIDYLFDLGSIATPKLGSNGFLVLRQGSNQYGSGLTTIAPGATDVVNTATSFTWGQTGNSSVGFSGELGKTILENSGFTAMLIRNDGDPNTDAPFVPTDPNTPLIDLDSDDDNELDSSGPLANWFVYDKIGINSEASDVNGLLYGDINFSAGSPDPNNPGAGNVPAGATFVDVGYEIEHLARWGDSTGSTAVDWHVTNSTDEGASGFDARPDWRQAADPHSAPDDPNSADQFVETNQGVPYGTYLFDNLGSSNVFILDGDVNAEYDGEEFVFDGRVDGLDFLRIQQNYGFGSGTFATREHGDSNRDRTVDSLDIAVWSANYGTTLASVNVAAVPEPSSLVLLLTLVAATGLRVRR